MKQTLFLHRWPVMALLLLANGVLLANLAAGDPKSWAAITWLDIAGEGGAAFLSLLWIGLILNSRPAGRVTRFLVAGLTAIFLAYWQDVLDEVIALPATTAWDHWLESGAMPLGMILLTLGIYHWHREQQAITVQLRKRERIFREHRRFDRLTSLNGAPYLREQLAMELRHREQPVALIMLDMHCFDHSRRLLGSADSDRLLQELAELLLLNLRHNDLLCRYAGDRFAVVLPRTGHALAQALADELQQAVASFAFKTRRGETHHVQVIHGLAVSFQDSADSLIARANRNLLQARPDQPRVA
ncbi:MAG: GGDEF domain-containing protein [Alcanivorax sp.]|uniref:GGDEF domain-containing protein n=1 Tax=Alcanivorax sp. TaxID=1872427 RepID=UPI003DA6F52C